MENVDEYPIDSSFFFNEDIIEEIAGNPVEDRCNEGVESKALILHSVPLLPSPIKVARRKGKSSRNGSARRSSKRKQVESADAASGFGKVIKIEEEWSVEDEQPEDLFELEPSLLQPGSSQKNNLKRKLEEERSEPKSKCTLKIETLSPQTKPEHDCGNLGRPRRNRRPVKYKEFEESESEKEFHVPVSKKKKSRFSIPIKNENPVLPLPKSQPKHRRKRTRTAGPPLRKSKETRKKTNAPKIADYRGKRTKLCKRPKKSKETYFKRLEEKQAKLKDWIRKKHVQTKINYERLAKYKVMLARKHLMQTDARDELYAKIEELINQFEFKKGTKTRRIRRFGKERRNLSKKRKRGRPKRSAGSKSNSQSGQPEKKRLRSSNTVHYNVVCDECGKLVPKLRTHKQQVHPPEPKKCPRCPNVYKTGRQIWRHFCLEHLKIELISGYHENEPTKKVDPNEMLAEKAEAPISHICQICGQTFSSPSALSRHEFLIHGEGSKVENFIDCPQCDKRFKSKATRDAHVRLVHEGKDNRCEHCGKRHQSAGKLWKHLKTKHGLDLPPPESIRKMIVQCEQCGETYSRGIGAHMRKCHPEVYDDFMKEKAKRDRQKRIESKRENRRKWREEGVGPKWCDPKKQRIYRYRRNRENQQKVVEWSCPACKQTFNDPSILGRHIKLVHNSLSEGEVTVELKKFIGSYACSKENCDQIYDRMCYLYTHILETHVGDDIYNRLAQRRMVRVQNANEFFHSYSCVICDFVCYSKEESKIHFLSAHSNIASDICRGSELKIPTLPFECQYCGQEIPYSEARLHVELTHPEECSQCPEPNCGMTILGPNDLLEHFFLEHNANGIPEDDGNETYDMEKGRCKCLCLKCDSKFRFQLELNEHVKEVHPHCFFLCTYCYKVQFTRLAFDYHLRFGCPARKNGEIEDQLNLGGDDTFVPIHQIQVKCVKCPSFLKLNQLDDHYEYEHGIPKETTWTCSKHRQKKFNGREEWLAHMEEWHGEKQDFHSLLEVVAKPYCEMNNPAPRSKPAKAIPRRINPNKKKQGRKPKLNSGKVKNGKTKGEKKTRGRKFKNAGKNSITKPCFVFLKRLTEAEIASYRA